MVPSLIHSMTNTLAFTVPVASVAVGLKPVPKVIVLDDVPLVKMIVVLRYPAGGTVVVKVLFAVTVSFVQSLTA